MRVTNSWAQAAVAMVVAVALAPACMSPDDEEPSTATADEAVTDEAMAPTTEAEAPAEAAALDYYYARAHATRCTNAIDGTESIISHNLCADGWGVTPEAAAWGAYFSLGTQTCLGPAWGCCEFVIDYDFSVCGK